MKEKLKAILNKAESIKLPKFPKLPKLPNISRVSKIKLDPLVKSVLVLVMIALISAIALAVINNITADLIHQNSVQARDEARKKIGEYAYQIEVSPKGYGGEINMIVGISSLGEVTGVAIIGMNETLGVGTRIQDDDFLNGFIGKRAGVSIGRDINDVDAVTGATVSSRAAAAGVNEALEIFAEISGGGQ
jgi:electron transport complex protein RnfG